MWPETTSRLQQRTASCAPPPPPPPFAPLASAAHAKRALLARHSIVGPSLRVAEGCGRVGVPRRTAARPDRPRRHRPGRQAEHRHGEPAGDRPARRRRIARTRRPGRLRRDRPSPGAVEVDHEPFLTLGIHVGARTTSIVATDLFGRTLDVVETPTPRSPQNPRWPRWPTAPAATCAAGTVAAHSGSGWPPAALSMPPGDTSTTPGLAGRTHRSGRCSPKRSGFRCRSPRTSTRWRVLNCCSECAAADPVDQPLRLRPRDRRLRADHRRPGAQACQRTRHDLKLPAQSELLGGTGLLESTVSDEAVLVAARRPDPAGPRPGVDGDGGPEDRPAGQQAGPGTARRAERSSAKPSPCCATCSTPTTWWSAVRRLPNTRRAWPAWRTPTPSGRCWPPATSGLPHSATGCRKRVRGWSGCGGLYADPIGAMRRAVTRRPEVSA